MSQNTIKQFREVTSACREIFRKKNSDYGTSWRILRLSSITDQIYIKAKRIRSIEESGVNKVGEGIDGEFMGIINYCVIALIQHEIAGKNLPEPDRDEIMNLYDRQVELTLQLMETKNHDYGEAWRDMRVSTFTDLILMKLLRVKQIEDNEGKTLISEGVDANFRDIFNYSVFALIRLK